MSNPTNNHLRTRESATTDSTTTGRLRRRNRLLGGIAAGALLLAACGGEVDQSAGAADNPAEEQAAAEEEAGSEEQAAASDTSATVDVLSGTTDLGDVLVGPDGRTLYAFTNDVSAASTCYGTCAEAWPPVLVSDDWTAGPGLDFGIFATTVRDDGSTQLVAGAWPLYYFAGDAVPGDVSGQGSGNVWFAVDLDGGLIRDGASADAAAEEAAADEAGGDDAGAEGPVSEADTDLGPILVDEAGLSLYGFLDDRDAETPSRRDACADAWPPALVDGSDLPAGLDPEVFSVVGRHDGTNQLQAGIWPLYRFAGDGAPGDINGQESGDVWYLAAPDGSLIGVGGAAPAEADAADTDTNTEDGDEETGGGSDY